MSGRESGRPQSMKDFDYFSDAALPAAGEGGGLPEDLPAGLEAQMRAFRAQRRRHVRFFVLSGAFFAVSAWFLAGYADWMRYVFAQDSAPRDLGDVVEVTPELIEHNSFVRLRGITEHRALKQEFVRGLSWGRKEYWYFRLVGSRGVFIEVPPDREAFGVAQAVDVVGRAVDPERERVYQPMLRTYAELYFSAKGTSARVIQVDVRPGQGRTPFVLALVLLGGVAVMNVLALVRLLQLRRGHHLVVQRSEGNS